MYRWCVSLTGLPSSDTVRHQTTAWKFVSRQKSENVMFYTKSTCTTGKMPFVLGMRTAKSWPSTGACAPQDHVVLRWRGRNSSSDCETRVAVSKKILVTFLAECFPEWLPRAEGLHRNGDYVCHSHIWLLVVFLQDLFWVTDSWATRIRIIGVTVSGATYVTSCFSHGQLLCSCGPGTTPQNFNHTKLQRQRRKRRKKKKGKVQKKEWQKERKDWHTDRRTHKWMALNVKQYVKYYLLLF